MGLFSSSSKSSSSTTNNTAQFSASIGDLSSGNVLVGGDYNPVGLDGQNLQIVTDMMKSNYTNSVTAVQSLAEKAINTSANAYAGASSETKQFFDAIRPFGFYIVAGLVVYYLMKGK